MEIVENSSEVYIYFYIIVFSGKFPLTIKQNNFYIITTNIIEIIISTSHKGVMRLNMVYVFCIPT
jgi:hypothetical protein